MIADVKAAARELTPEALSTLQTVMEEPENAVGGARRGCDGYFGQGMGSTDAVD